MELELQKYECGSEDYLIYDCNRNRYEFGAREARVMCSLNIGISVRRVLVGPIWQTTGMTFLTYNSDGTLSVPQTEDVKVFEKYLNDAGYEKTACLDHEIRKVCKIAFFENFVEKYQLTECKKRHDVS